MGTESSRDVDGYEGYWRLGDLHRSLRGRMDDLESDLAAQIAGGFRRRDERVLLSTFDAHKCPVRKLLMRENLDAAFASLDLIGLDSAKVDEIFFAMDVNNDGCLDFEEFKMAVRTPSPLEQFVASMPLTNIVADAVPRRRGVEQLAVMANLTSDEIKCMAKCVVQGLTSLLENYCRDLKCAISAMETKSTSLAASKFKIEKMSSGKIKDFHCGLIERIGTASLNFFEAMESEHCTKAGSTFTFTTSNYNITTTAKDEWEIVVHRKLEKASMAFNRIIPNLEQLRSLPVAEASELIDVEIIALILYTGPLYTIYNAILRKFPLELVKTFDDGENSFSTTIHCLVSAVQKIARVMKLPHGIRLYRGLGGNLDLPSWFYKSDDNGCRGIVEWGFMSTTSEKTVAISYSGVKQGKPLASVFEIEVGAVDRGACIRDFSQYPGEVEYLWVPCCFVEPGAPSFLEVTKDGLVTIIPVRVNANLKMSTLEELLVQKQRMHLTSFRYLLHDLKRELHMAATMHGAEDILKRPGQAAGHTVKGFINGILKECESFFERHKALDSKEFVKDEVFRALTTEMLDVKSMGTSKLMAWITDSTQDISWFKNVPLRMAYRTRIAYLLRTMQEKAGPHAAALELCKIRGLLKDSVEESNEIGETKLISCAAEGADEATLGLLIAARANVNAANSDGESAIIQAGRFGQSHCIRFLVANKADINASTEFKQTSLIWAASMGHVDAIKVLLDSKAKIDQSDKFKMTPLHWASYHGRTTSAEVLLKAKADVNAKDSGGQTPFQIASNEDCRRLLAACK